MAAAIGLLACAGGSRLERGDHPPAASTVGPAATVAASAPVPFPALSASGPVVDERGATSARAQSTAPEPSASGAVAAPSGRCPQDMVDVALACIDRYEAPNRAGEKPLVMQSLPDAESWCREHGKRLCTEDEWLRACRGRPERSWAYPYGPTYQEHACNQDAKYIPPSWQRLGRWPADEAKAEVARLNQAEPSGARPTCVTPEGVFDLTGNVGEWIVRQHPHPEACLTPEQEQHQHVVKGCFWGKCYRVPHEPACDYVNCSHPDGFRSYEFGFRCCRDAQR
jgi:formylglycine-generating enzyme required for sulfatase activity